MVSGSVDETVGAGEQFADKLKQGDVVLLNGDLGAGKTHFVKGVARYFGIPEEEVQSPTFALVHEYSGNIPVYHLDCYRLQDQARALEIGLEEYVDGDGICLIEWPDVITPLLPGTYWIIEIEHVSEHEREISIHQSA